MAVHTLAVGTLSEQRVKVHITQREWWNWSILTGLDFMESRNSRKNATVSLFRCTQKQSEGQPERERIRWRGLQSHKPAGRINFTVPFCDADTGGSDAMRPLNRMLRIRDSAQSSAVWPSASTEQPSSETMLKRCIVGVLASTRRTHERHSRRSAAASPEFRERSTRRAGRGLLFQSQNRQFELVLLHAYLVWQRIRMARAVPLRGDSGHAGARKVQAAYSGSGREDPRPRRRVDRPRRSGDAAADRRECRDMVAMCAAGTGAIIFTTSSPSSAVLCLRLGTRRTIARNP